VIFILIFSVVLFSLLVLYLLFFYRRNDQKNEIIAGSNGIDKGFYDFHYKETNEKVEAVLSINGVDFSFDYKKENAADVLSIVKFIKQSLIVMRSSKYDDIVDSRFNEIVSKLKELVKLSSLGKTKHDEILEEIRNYG